MKLPHSKLHILPLFLAAVLLSGCSMPFETEPESSPAVPVMAEPEAVITEPPAETTVITTEATEPSASPQEILEEYVQSLTLQQKVGQLFVVTPAALSEGAETSVTTVLTDAARETMSACPPGGIILFAENMESGQQLRTLTGDLQAACPTPLFLSVDEEGGSVARLAHTPSLDLPQFPSASRFGGDSEAVRQMGEAIGKYLNQYGFNTDFAPVADINTNPHNPVIGKRAFSSDPAQVSQCAAAMSEGLLSQGVIPVYKHFPGHGDTTQDSHKKLAVSHKTAPEQESCEWLPYEGLSNQVMVMMGHIALPQVTGDMIPASLSRPIVTDILKNQLGFGGLVITDSLQMKAITDSYTSADAALAALNAGCDLLLMPESYREAFEGVLYALENGSYSEKSLNETVTRILQFKITHGILVL